MNPAPFQLRPYGDNIGPGGLQVRFSLPELSQGLIAIQLREDLVRNDPVSRIHLQLPYDTAGFAADFDTVELDSDLYL
jgi:hypothetical protein